MSKVTESAHEAYLQPRLVGDIPPCQENIDFFHIHEAYQCISAWFGAHGTRRQWAANKFYDALFEQVRVIRYEAADDLDATTLFTRLNVGRIPLTDAELVKALLLSRSRGDAGRTDRALEIAAQWDAIERDLRYPELWAFVTGRDSSCPTRIGLLLDTIAGGPVGRDRPLFHTFETLREQITASTQEFWNEVVDLHSLVTGWYDNQDLFQKIGYLIAQGTSFSGLIEGEVRPVDVHVRTVAGERTAGLIVRGLGEAAVRDGDVVAAVPRRADDPVTDEAGSPEHDQAHATITAFGFAGWPGEICPQHIGTESLWPRRAPSAREPVTQSIVDISRLPTAGRNLLAESPPEPVRWQGSHVRKDGTSRPV